MDKRAKCIILSKIERTLKILYRLEFWNLKRQDTSNALNYDEVAKIWVPHLVFSNTEKNDITEGDDKTEIVVSRLSEPE